MLFLLYSKMNWPNIYIYSLSFGLPSHSYHHSALSSLCYTVCSHHVVYFMYSP